MEKHIRKLKAGKNILLPTQKVAQSFEEVEYKSTCDDF